jgi:hypothetical protein
MLLPDIAALNYEGCLAPYSTMRGAILPTPRQQGMEGPAASTGASRWRWARLLKRVFALALAHCPCCQRGARRVIAAITQEEVITRMLRHLQLFLSRRVVELWSHISLRDDKPLEVRNREDTWMIW